MSDILKILKIIADIQSRNLDIKKKIAELSTSKKMSEDDEEEEKIFYESNPSDKLFLRKPLIITKVNRDELKKQISDKFDKLRKESMEEQKDISLKSGQLKSIIATIGSIIKNDKLVYFIGDDKKTISYKELFKITDENYNKLISGINAIGSTIPPIDYLQSFTINIFEFIINNKQLSLPELSKTINSTLPKLSKETHEQSEGVKFDFTIFSSKEENKPLCGNKFKPKTGQLTFKTIKECWDAVNAGKFGFKDKTIAKLMEEFWINKIPPKLNGKYIDKITEYVGHYSILLEKLKSDVNINEIEIASKLIKYYKDNFKFVVTNTKNGKKCYVKIPEKDEITYDSYTECTKKISKS